MSVQSYTRIHTGHIGAPSPIVARAAIWKAIRERRAQRGDTAAIVVEEEHIETTSLHRVLRVVGEEAQGEVFTVYEGEYMTRVVSTDDAELGALLPPHCVLKLAPLAYLGAAEGMIHRSHGEDVFPVLAGGGAAAGDAAASGAAAGGAAAGDGAPRSETGGQTLPLFAQ
jgi:hypothetical protein